MKKGKIAIIILSILLTISVIGNIALIIMVNTNDKAEIKEESKETNKTETKEDIVESNPDIKYVGKWEYSYSSEESFILSNGSSAKGLDSYSSILEIDNNLNVTMTKDTRRDCLNADGSQILTTIDKEVYKGEVRNDTIIFKEKTENDSPKKEIREVHRIYIYSDDTLAYYLNDRNDEHNFYIKK